MRLYNTLVYYGQKLNSYHIPTYAAGASFFLITALFPLLMLGIAIVNFTPLSTQDFLDMIAMVLPDSLAALLENLASDLMTSSSATALSLSLVAIIWTAGKSMLGLLDGLNAIADVVDTRSYLLKRIICIFYTLALLVGLLINLALRVFGHHILALLEQTVPGVAEVFSTILSQKGLTLFLLMTLVFMLVYTAFPNKRLKVYMQIPGAVFTSLAWMVFSWLFSIYVNRIGQFSALYGGLTMMILAMLWLYACMYIVFIGAVVNKVCPELFWRAVVTGKRWGNSRSPGTSAKESDT